MAESAKPTLNPFPGDKPAQAGASDVEMQQTGGTATTPASETVVGDDGLQLQDEVQIWTTCCQMLLLRT
jgi:hypothetical protein